MIISVTKVRAHPILGPIIEQHNDVVESREQIILTLFLLFELTKGRNSYWYPYLRILPEVESLTHWQEFEIEML